MQSPLRLPFSAWSAIELTGFNPKRDAIPFATTITKSDGNRFFQVSIPSEMQSPLRRERISWVNSVMRGFQSQARCNPLCDDSFPHRSIEAHNVSIPSEMQSPLRRAIELRHDCGRKVSIPSEMQSPLRPRPHNPALSSDSSFNPKRDAIPFATVKVQKTSGMPACVSIPSEMQSPLRRQGCRVGTRARWWFQSQARCNPLCDFQIMCEQGHLLQCFNPKRDAIPFATENIRFERRTAIEVSIPSEMQSPLRHGS